MGKIIITLHTNKNKIMLIRHTRRIFATVLLSLLCLSALSSTTTYPFPKYEARAVWLTTIGGLDWPQTYSNSPETEQIQKRELCRILDKLQAANVNIVLLQTRIRGTVIYPSAFEPWDGCLSGRPGVSPGYDALKFAIEECHKRGMELHAWVVAIPVGKWNAAGCSKIRKGYPALAHRIGAEGYLDPERVGTADYLARICTEITENYDVDGIHLDYIRYPENWNKRIDRSAGRANITRIVRRIYAAVKASKPWVKLSCSPVGKHSDLQRYSSHGWNAYHKVCQDAQGWLAEGIMDAIFPMMYFKGNQFYPFAFDWLENSRGRIVGAGLGLYFLSPRERDWDSEVIKRELHVLRRHGIGHAYFRSKFFTDNTKGVYNFSKDVIDPVPALVPPMKWQSPTPPSAPTALNVSRHADMDILSWGSAKDNSDGPYLTYNIYASEQYPVDTHDSRNILAVRQKKQEIAIPHQTTATELNYAVTAVDRYGNESAAIASLRKHTMTASTASLLDNDGMTMRIPVNRNTTDADLIIIESLQGVIVATRQLNDSVNISDIPCGFYVLKTLNEKGIAHRLGLFTVKRLQR